MNTRLTARLATHWAIGSAVLATLVGTGLAADSTYEVRHSPVKAVVGAKATAAVTLAAKNGWHLNAEAPITMKLTPAQGVAVDKPRLTRADLAKSSENSASFDVGFTASEPGAREIQAEASFVICQESACRPIKEKLVIAITASAAGKQKPVGGTR